ncbi:MAG: gluconate 2-dehydrogenase subunit 3 family protein [Acidobacteriaceae bacterium]|nr:gluconate 2-dehydrogenase subunit 3 family protein [Acidobacteriaceae bacterium]
MPFTRRTALRSLIATPAVAVLPAALPAQEPVQPPPPNAAPSETPQTPTVNADSFADGVRTTFTPEQFAALKKLGDIIAPESPNSPGALQANTAEFLDFFVGQSPEDRLPLYHDGLNALNEQAQRRYDKPFARISAAEAAPILAPLREPWTYKQSDAPFPRFLRVAKDDILGATMSSREYVTVVARRRRGAGGSGQYWLPIE